MSTHEASDMRQAIEGTAARDERDERCEHLLVAARRVWTGAIPDPKHPNRVIVKREAMDGLGEIIAAF